MLIGRQVVLAQELFLLLDALADAFYLLAAFFGAVVVDEGGGLVVIAELEGELAGHDRGFRAAVAADKNHPRPMRRE